MPVAFVNVLAGHPRPVLKQLVREVASAYATALAAPIEKVQVWVTEYDPALCAVAGETAEDLLATEPRADVEIPFIRLVMMEGRSIETVHETMRILTDTVASVLQGDPSRVRVEVQNVPAERWSIGGIPVSIARAAGR